MKKKTIVIAIVSFIIGFGAVVFALDPFDIRGNGISPSGNMTPEEPPIESNWISPGKLFVEGYEAGRTVELQIQVHNGNTAGSCTYNFTVTTGAGQTEAVISLKQSLENDSLDSIENIRSSSSTDNPVAVAYDSKTLKLSVAGLKADISRTLSVTYMQDGSKFSVDFRFPDNLAEGYAKPMGASGWVRIKEKFPIIGAHETHVATFYLYMPSGTVPPGDKWEFWIGVIDQSQTGMIQVELCTKVLVTMG